MVQIYEDAPTFGQQFFGNLGKGFGEQFGEEITSGIERRRQEKKQQEFSKEISKFLGQDVSKWSPEMQKEAVKQKLISDYAPDKFKSQYEAKYNAQKKFFDELNPFSDEEAPEPTQQQSPDTEQIQPRGILSPEFEQQGKTSPKEKTIPIQKGKMFSNKKIAETAVFFPATAQQMRASNEENERNRRHEETENREKEKETQRRIEVNRKETFPIRKEYADKAKNARTLQENKKNQLALLKKGKVDSPLTNYMASLLPGAVGGLLLSSDTQLYKSGLFDEFGIIKQMFPGAVRVKELDLLEDKLATLDKSHEAKARILENGIKKLDRDIILAKAARDVEKENPNASVLEFEELVQEKAQPELDKLYKEMIDEYDKIFYEFAPPKSSYVDQYGDEYNNIPKSDLKRLFEETKSQGLELRTR